MDNITVLSTACGAMFMPGFFRCLKSNGERNIRIIGVDIIDSPMMELIVDKYYRIPPYSAPNYISALLDICKNEHVDILFPHISMELPVINENKYKFEELGVKISISNLDTLDIANSKFKLYEFMRSIDLKTPNYRLVESVEDLISASKFLGYPEKPVCLKITQSSGSRGVRIIKSDISKSWIFVNQKPSSLYVTLDEMVEILKEMDTIPEMIVMDYLPGCEYTVDLLADHGKVLYIAGRRNTVSSASIAMESVVEYKKEAYDLCSSIVEGLALDGNIGFDFMLDENDNPYLTDLNPRITATIIIFLAAGINFPYMRVKQLLGETLPKLNVKYGTRLIRKYDDILLAGN